MKPTNNAKPSPLLASAQQRTASVVKKLQDAMKIMAAEIAQNDGSYPSNKGRVTQAEVCRRAGVNKMTLQGEAHKRTTKIEVDEWVEKAQHKKPSQKKTRENMDSATHWKQELALLAQATHENHLEMIGLREDMEKLRQENLGLKEKMAKMLACQRPS